MRALVAAFVVLVLLVSAASASPVPKQKKDQDIQDIVGVLLSIAASGMPVEKKQKPKKVKKLLPTPEGKHILGGGDPVVQRTIESQFPNAPIMIKVAKCESGLRQYDQNGSVVHGLIHHADSGVFQINKSVHAATAKKLGINLDSTRGNIAFARLLYKKAGMRPWISSRWCWGRHQTAEINIRRSSKPSDLYPGAFFFTLCIWMISMVWSRSDNFVLSGGVDMFVMRLATAVVLFSSVVSISARAGEKNWGQMNVAERLAWAQKFASQACPYGVAISNEDASKKNEIANAPQLGVELYIYTHCRDTPVASVSR